MIGIRFLAILLTTALCVLDVTARSITRSQSRRRGSKKPCSWDKDQDFPATAPLLMDQKSWTPILPVQDEDTKQRIVSVAAGAAVVVACPGSVITKLGAATAAATCQGGETLRVNGKNYPLSSLGCSKMPKESLLNTTETCGGTGLLTHVGFDVEDFQFYPTYSICFDYKTEANLFSQHIVRGAHISAKDIAPGRPSFKSSKGFYSISVSTCYKNSNQEEVLDNLLHNDTVFNASVSHYFARGHMSPDGDFVTEMEQDSTYYYANVIPQWQNINNGNWKDVEVDTRVLAAALARDVQVWSGSWQVLQLQDYHHKETLIYLGQHYHKNLIPVPAAMWKVVYDAEADAGAAVVTVNDPFSLAALSPVCGSVALCAQLKWLFSNFADVTNGPTYCCTIRDLAAAIPSAPQHLDSASLLTHA